MLLSIIIPAHNEEECLYSTVAALCATLTEAVIPFEILVVNDHSTDGTAEVLGELTCSYAQVRWVNNLKAGGFGYAIHTGLENYAGDAVCIVMADASDDPQDMVKYYHKLQEGYECVFGSRFAPTSRVVDYPIHKLLINRLANWFIQLLFGIPLNDTTNAFKCYRREVIDGLQPLLACHFNLTVELPLKAITRGYSYAVVPIHWYNRTTGFSKLKIKEMGSRYLFVILYIWLEKLLSQGDYHRRTGSWPKEISSTPSQLTPAHQLGLALSTYREPLSSVANTRPTAHSAWLNWVRRWGKGLTLIGCSVLNFALALLHLPDPTLAFTSLAPTSGFTPDHSWIVSLASLWRQGDISGRDFYFTYGPLAQALAWFGAQWNVHGSIFDTLPLLLLCYWSVGILLLGLLLALLPQLNALHCLLIYLILHILDSIVLNGVSFRGLMAVIFAVVLARALGSTSRRSLSLAALAGLLAFLSQLLTAELGVLTIMAACAILGLYMVLAWLPASARRSDLHPAPHYGLLLGTVLGTYLLCNLGISVFFALSSPTYGDLFNYQRYSLEIIRGYNYSMAWAWELDRFQTRGLAVIVLSVVGYIGVNFRRIKTADGYVLVSLLVMAVLQSKGAIVRSDIFHVMQGFTTFILLFLFLLHDWAALGRRRFVWLTLWTVLLALLLRAWPTADIRSINQVTLLLNGAGSPSARWQYFTTLRTPASAYLPAGLVDEGDSTPILHFPYENHLSSAVSRPLVAPVLQPYAAHTETLQRRYIEMIETTPGLAITYGLDDITSYAIDQVQHVSRVPRIFEYLYQHFELETRHSFGGFYRLRRRIQPAAMLASPVPMQIEQAHGSTVSLAASQPIECSLVRLTMTISYPLTAALGRPNPVSVSVLANGTSIHTSKVVAIEPGRAFTTYISLIDPFRFAEVFGPTGVQVKAWDGLHVEPHRTGLFQVSPSRITINQVECITLPATQTVTPITAADMPALARDVPPLYEGFIDAINCQNGISGWVWDINRPYNAVKVDIYASDRLIGTVSANILRQDLVHEGKGTGQHGFWWPIPPALRDNKDHALQIRLPGLQSALQPYQGALRCPAP